MKSFSKLCLQMRRRSMKYVTELRGLHVQILSTARVGDMSDPTFLPVDNNLKPFI